MRIITICATLLITASVFGSMEVFAQAPNKMSYQAVIRNDKNALLTNQTLGMRISILKSSSSGAAVYIETQTSTSNANGLVSIAIGTGTALSGPFSSIDWANGPYFIKTETDPAGGVNYSITATNELMSVPYALHSVNGTPGPQGPIGLTGPAGPAGPKGLTGPAGATGNGFQNGTALNQMMYWNGSTWVTLSPGSNGQVLSVCNGSLTWVTMAGVCAVASITSINCAGATITGKLTSGQIASDVTVTISYTGGNALNYSAQSVSSTGVSGLTANLSAGTLANGSGTLTYTIGGTPSTSGTVSFGITLGGQSCSLSLTAATSSTIPAPVFCSGIPTAIVDVTNPTTGKTWMDRNLGASQAATSSEDEKSYGDLYQWGRRSDGHQCRTSATTTTLSSVDQPTHGDFILAPNSPYDWRSNQNSSLWQGVNGVNNPCPSSYRLPTEAEFNAETLSWSNKNAAGALSSSLKLPLSGNRNNNGEFSFVGSGFSFWLSSVTGTFSNNFAFDGNRLLMSTSRRFYANSVRCIKN